ncbi:MAG: hypothetical protein LT070_12025 [Solirubrobacteraceae bacterium]|nr:hypothetical protein [Solirubrobacteraceae bacterium]
MASREEAERSVKDGLSNHADTCPLPAQAVLVHPDTKAEFGWDYLCGLPVDEDARVPLGRFRVQCEGSAHGLEEQFAPLLAATARGEGPVPSKA